MNVLPKNKNGYGYKYTDLAQIHKYLEEVGLKYHQYIQRIDTDDYIFTVVYDAETGEEWPKMQGCRVVQATLSGKSNPAQEQGSALTYARRYSLLMALGLATDDDDAEALTRQKPTKPKPNHNYSTRTSVMGMIADMGKTERDICNYFNIPDLASMTEGQYDSLLAIYGKWKEKGEKA